MFLIPAIDLQGGRVARHDAADGRTTVYADDPVAQAEAFIGEGATWLHVVDLDRAFALGGDNDAMIRRLTALRGARVQLGGNLASADDIRRGSGLGASRLVAGTATLLDPALLSDVVAAADGASLAAAIDVQDGHVTLRRDSREVRHTPLHLVQRALVVGIKTVLLRDLTRDGTLAGAAVTLGKGLSGHGADIVVAGGAASLDEITEAAKGGVAGMIVGRALYERRFTLTEALRCSASR
ncbi:MAG TPA: HisA/HisF-related TIM barrel protein [Gemmatimonadales bacterium]